MEFIIDDGDTVAARLETPEGVIPLEFVVTRVDGTTYHGSPLGALNTADGWTLELIRKDTPHLPDTLADVAAWTIYDRVTPVHIVGPVDGVWQVVGGRIIDPAVILGWVPWSEYTPPPAPVITVPADHPDAADFTEPAE